MSSQSAMAAVKLHSLSDKQTLCSASHTTSQPGSSLPPSAITPPSCQSVQQSASPKLSTLSSCITQARQKSHVWNVCEHTHTCSGLLPVVLEKDSKNKREKLELSFSMTHLERKVCWECLSKVFVYTHTLCSEAWL